MILFAAVTRQSVAACFAATIGPAILLIIGLCIANFSCSANTAPCRFRNPHPGPVNPETAPAGPLHPPGLAGHVPARHYSGRHLWGHFHPYGGGGRIRRCRVYHRLFHLSGMTPRTMVTSVVDAAETTGVILIILLFSLVVGRIFSMERVPQQITEFMLATFKDPFWILLVVNLFLIAAGMIVDDLSVTVIISLCCCRSWKPTGYTRFILPPLWAPVWLSVPTARRRPLFFIWPAASENAKSMKPSGPL